MTDSFIAKSLFKVLAGKDRGLADRFLAMQERALTDWIPLLRVDKGSHAGLVHLINVGRNVDKMIPDDKKGELSAGEIFLLLTAVLFHDIGRILSPETKRAECEKPPCKDGKPPDWAPPCKEGKPPDWAPPCTKLEWDHYIDSEKLILAIGQEQGLPDAMAAKYCALLAYCHGLYMPPRVEQKRFNGVVCNEKEELKPEFRNTSIEPLGSVRIPMLAAVLRIADETENHWTRAINERWYNYLAQNQQNLSKAFRRRVEDVEFSSAGECIVMHLEEIPKDPELSRFAGVSREIEAVLENWSRELRPLGLDFNRVFYETGGKLWRFLDATQPDGSVQQDPERVYSPMTQVMKKDTGAAEDLEQNSLRIQHLHKALVSLSKITMGYPDFTLAAIEAEAGRPLNDRDRWLMERIADWVPWAISVDSVRQRVRVHIKSGTDGTDDRQKALKTLSMELIGE
jgi:hypothetical protein